MRGPAVRRRVVRIEAGSARVTTDGVAAEEPLEIRAGTTPLAVTMRTPGNDFELVAGWLYAEGLIVERTDLGDMRYCVGRAGEEVQEYNVVDADVRGPAGARRSFVTSSACGICGSASVDDVRTRARFDVSSDGVRVTAAVLAGLPATLRDAQKLFDATGGVHGAGLFDAEGTLVCCREDVGRHNAFDKVIGWAFLERALPLRGHVMLASGRASFELVQKALLAGVPVVAAVGAPSSLAVDLASESGMTLVGFLRGRAMNVYSGEHRITP